MRCTVALFGEAERGLLEAPHFVKDLPHLMDLLGNPPDQSEGLFYAIQALLYQRDVIYFRVKREGFSLQDYFSGLEILKMKGPIKGLHAICMPGVGDPQILEATKTLCGPYNTPLIVSEKDLFDYLTEPSFK